MKTIVRSMLSCIVISSVTLLLSCASGGSGGVVGNENGSEPINDKESLEYKKAIVRCYKTGGNRVVKIMGELRCY